MLLLRGKRNLSLTVASFPEKKILFCLSAKKMFGLFLSFRLSFFFCRSFFFLVLTKFAFSLPALFKNCAVFFFSRINRSLFLYCLLNNEEVNWLVCAIALMAEQLSNV